MKVIITGATGFLGRNLAERLHHDGVEVLATGRRMDIGGELTQQGIPFEPVDILDPDRLAAVFSPADCVIHCAALSSPWGRYRNFYRPNVIGTRRVIDACRRHGIPKFIFISTPSVYYTHRDRLNVREDQPLPRRQLSSYARSKAISESELLGLSGPDFQVIIFRPRAIYGRHDNTIVPRLLRLAEKKRMPVIGRGQALIDITYVDNFVEAVVSSLSAGDDAWNEVYNISNGDPITVDGWFAQVLKIFSRPYRPKYVSEPVAYTMAAVMELFSYLPFINREPPMTRYTVGYLGKSMTLNIDKARRKLGYSPRISNQQGYEKYKRWYQRHSAGETRR